MDAFSSSFFILRFWLTELPDMFSEHTIQLALRRKTLRTVFTIAVEAKSFITCEYLTLLSEVSNVIVLAVHV